ncbi:MAG TPA: hypothetical protein VJA44_06865 [Acidimicrobiia bacterium]|nr:hypothetical protein [Acidimicrobiia bacterium]
MPRPLVIAVGLLTGAALAATGIVLAPNSPPEPDIAATTTVPAVPQSWWVDPHETIVASSAVVPGELSLEDGEVVFRYDLVSIGPMMRGFVFEDDHLIGVAPETWTLLTTDGEYPGTTSTITSFEARFPVEDGFLLESVTGIRLDGYRLRIPYTYHLEMPPTEGAQVELGDDRTLALVTLLPQATSVVVQLRFSQPDDPFSTHSTDMTVTGVGAEWLRTTNLQISGSELFRIGPDVPDPLVLRVHSIYWIPYQAAIDIDLGGIDRG